MRAKSIHYFPLDSHSPLAVGSSTNTGLMKSMQTYPDTHCHREHFLFLIFMLSKAEQWKCSGKNKDFSFWTNTISHSEWCYTFSLNLMTNSDICSYLIHSWILAYIFVTHQGANIADKESMALIFVMDCLCVSQDSLDGVSVAKSRLLVAEYNLLVLNTQGPWWLDQPSSQMLLVDMAKGKGVLRVSQG